MAQAGRLVVQAKNALQLTRRNFTTSAKRSGGGDWAAAERFGDKGPHFDYNRLNNGAAGETLFGWSKTNNPVMITLGFVLYASSGFTMSTVLFCNLVARKR